MQRLILTIDLVYGAHTLVYQRSRCEARSFDGARRSFAACKGQSWGRLFHRLATACGPRLGLDERARHVVKVRRGLQLRQAACGDSSPSERSPGARPSQLLADRKVPLQDYACRNILLRRRDVPSSQSLFQKQRLTLRRLLRYAKGLEGCSRRRRTAPSGTSFEAASRRLRTRTQAFGSGSQRCGAMSVKPKSSPLNSKGSSKTFARA